jgi:hypothetical protein
MQRSLSFSEPLEARRLLAGVTLLMHGNDGSVNGWVSAAADAIADRTDGSASIYTLTVGKNSRGRLAVTGYELNNGPELEDNGSGEAIIKVDWTAVDSGSESTGNVGRVIGDYLLSSHGAHRSLAELPIHLIGHSRGASLGVAISAVLAERGVWVEQQTFLDPHPVDGKNDFLGANYGDVPMRIYDNVAFADNYWRSDGNSQNLDFDGEPVEGAHEGNLNESVQQDFIISAHMAVTAYYHGTIDDDALFNNDHPVLGSWYSNTDAKPPRSRTGFYFSQIAGGKRPADGLGTQFGGTAPRVGVGAYGTQYPNAAHVRVLNGSSFASGTRLSLRFIAEDRDSSAQYTVFLDPDQNPYNGNNVMTMRRVVLDGVDDLSGVRISALSDGAPTGDYYVGVQTADTGGHLRIAYSSKVTVTNASSRRHTQAISSGAPTFSNTPIFGAHSTRDRIAAQVLQTA